MAAWKRPTVTMPRYMARFRCIGGECEQSCCEGWNIEVEPKAFRQVKERAPEPLRADFLDAVKVKQGADGRQRKLIAQATAACEMRDNCGNCRIQAALGASALPAICYVYPRGALRIDDDVTVFADLSCPEAVRLALFDPEALQTEPAEFDPLTVNRCPTVRIRTNGAEHRRVFDVIQRFCDATLVRRDMPFWQRVFVVGLMFELFGKAGITAPVPQALAVIESLNERLENGSLTAKLRDVRGSAANQLTALMPLLDRWLTNRFMGLSFAARGGSVELVRDLAYALKMETGGQATIDAYTRAFSGVYAPWAARNPHVVENLFRVPFAMRGTHARMHHGLDILWQDGLVFAITRMLLIAQAARRGPEFSEADVVPVVMAVWRRIQHDKTFVEEIRSAFKAAGCASLMHLCALLAPLPTQEPAHTIY